MSALNIINRLINAGMSVNGALGMWGNIDKESEGGISNNVENGRSKYDDATYTRYVDEGRLDFVYDQIGYGICQWTFWSRKQGLLNLARSRGVSISDENMQVDFLISELKSPQYIKVWNYCCDPNVSIYDATHYVMVNFEKPARDTTDERYQRAITAYNKYGPQLNGEVEDVAEIPNKTQNISKDPFVLPMIKRGSKGIIVVILQTALKCHGYHDDKNPKWIDGDFGSGTESKLRAFQRFKGIEADGICGNQTWNALLG